MLNLQNEILALPYKLIMCQPQLDIVIVIDRHYKRRHHHHYYYHRHDGHHLEPDDGRRAAHSVCTAVKSYNKSA